MSLILYPRDHQNPKKFLALLYDMSSVIRPRKSISEAGNLPFSTSSPIRLQRMRRKYSCRGYETKLLESVSIPTNLLSNPSNERLLSWLMMPVSWSRNHHPEPNWILPGSDPSW